MTENATLSEVSAGRCLFLAPMKPPDHPNPSGDRMIARQFLRLLHRLGFVVDIPSVLRTRCASPDAFPAIRDAAAAELARCIARELDRPATARASLVFTYHNYYKAPDLIGPALAHALDIPYVIAESSRAPDRAHGPWAEAHAWAEKASDAAALILTPTARDALMLERYRPFHQQIIRLKPFIDLEEWPEAGKRAGSPAESTVKLLSIAMMRPGVKIQSYALLAKALHHLPIPGWTLDIVGDGEGRGEVEQMFHAFGPKVRFHGAIEAKSALGAFYANADVFVWPGVGEAIGMVYLEAQAHGLPCLAYCYGGVEDAVADGISGFLVASGEEVLFAKKLSLLIADSTARAHIGRKAQAHIQRAHSLEAAADVLAQAFASIGLKTPVALSRPSPGQESAHARR